MYHLNNSQDKSQKVTGFASDLMGHPLYARKGLLRRTAFNSSRRCATWHMVTFNLQLQKHSLKFTS